MPGANFILDKGFQAQTAITKFMVVKHGTADQTCTAVTTLNDASLGIAQEDASAGNVTQGRIINVRILGISRVIAGAALTRGSRVRAAASGKVVAAPGAPSATPDNIVGLLMDSAGADGDIVDILLTPGVTFNAAVS